MLPTALLPTTLALVALLAAPTAAQDPSAKFFEPGRVVELTLEVAPPEVEQLRADPRKYVACVLREDGKQVYQRVAVKLKGAAGSFRELDDKPAFTLRMDREDAEQRFHGLAKLHLNNSVQDESYLCEALCSEILARAGVPAPRVAHARVRWNERDLGLYVLKEGFDPLFLARHFPDASGNLYDGGFCTDLDGELEKDAGKGVDDRGDLRALVEACRDEDPQARWIRLEQQLDIERFLRFVALELCLGHWDGYALTANNYRLYCDPKSGQASFLPHGMDQVFQDPEAPVLDPLNAIVAQAVMRNPAWRKRYRAILAAVVRELRLTEKSVPLAKKLASRLQPVLRSIDPELAAAHADRVRELVERLELREKSLQEQVQRPEPKVQSFDSQGRATITGFEAEIEEGDPVLEQDSVRAKRVYLIACGNDPCAASWRKRVLLPRGRYVFEARVRLEKVLAREQDPSSGAALRVSGRDAAQRALGNADAKQLQFEFEVEEEQLLVELVAELRARGGRALFDAASLRVRRLR
ncbi:MAG: CotH kinase family protein [Planctomycetes bacterium]|nr:CotH kinase family protein [Planctomycetota bacterium]